MRSQKLEGRTFWLALLAFASGAGLLAQAPRFSRAEYPAVDGSTSTQPLGALIASRLTRTSVEWWRSPLGGTRRLAFTSAPYDESKKLTIEPAPNEAASSRDLVAALGDISLLTERTYHHGTSQAYARLASGEALLALVARQPTPEERAAVRRAGSALVAVSIARDAFVFLRHAGNPVTSVTVEQIRDIYSGAIVNWQSLGGADRPIAAYQRDASSGSQVEMEQLVMRGRPMLSGPDIRLTYSMFGPFNAIRDNRDGIGYSYHYYERFMAPVPEIATFAINGVVPDRSTIADGRYPLVTFVYLVHRADLPPDSAAARVRDWIRTPAGQAVVAESGYVPF